MCLSFSVYLRFVAGPELVLELWTWMPLLVMFTCCRSWCMLYVTGQEDEECCSNHKQVLTEDFRCVLNKLSSLPCFFQMICMVFQLFRWKMTPSLGYLKKKKKSWMNEKCDNFYLYHFSLLGDPGGGHWDLLALWSALHCIVFLLSECSYKSPCSSVTVAILVQLAIWK